MNALPSHSALRLLLVDDNPALQVLISAIFRRRDVVVDCVGNGDAALERLGRESYDAVVLELMLPGRSGLEVIRALKHDEPELLGSIIVLTAADDRALRGFEDRRLVRGVLRKPLELGEFADMVLSCAPGALDHHRETFLEQAAQ